MNNLYFYKKTLFSIKPQIHFERIPFSLYVFMHGNDKQPKYFLTFKSRYSLTDETPITDI
jgi:hypothetical protein